MINSNLYKMELSRYKNSMLIWAAVICGMIFLDMALYQVFLNEGMLDKIKPFISSPMLAPMMKGFGLEIEKLSNIMGFYVIRNTPLILLLTGIFSILTSTSIFANEEFEKIAEFLYTKPLTRSEIFISKVLACYSHILLINILIVLVGYLSLEIFKTQDFSKSVYFLHSIYGILNSLVFSSIGFTLTALSKRGRGLFAISVGIVLGTYFLDIMSKISKSAEFIGYISPFRYVDTNVLVTAYTLRSGNILFFLLVTSILTLFSFGKYLRKDILN